MDPGGNSYLKKSNNFLISFTQFKNVAELGFWISKVEEAETVRHIVAVEPLTKIGEFDGVLDEDGVMLRTTDERFVPPQYKIVIFHWAPALYFTQRNIAILGRVIGGDAAPCLGSAP